MSDGQTTILARLDARAAQNATARHSLIAGAIFGFSLWVWGGALIAEFRDPSRGGFSARLTAGVGTLEGEMVLIGVLLAIVGIAAFYPKVFGGSRISGALVALVQLALCVASFRKLGASWMVTGLLAAALLLSGVAVRIFADRAAARPFPTKRKH